MYPCAAIQIISARTGSARATYSSRSARAALFAVLALLPFLLLRHGAAQTVTGVPVTYHAGWTIAGGPDGTVFNSIGSIYSLDAGDSGYVAGPSNAPVAGGKGYWVYFATDTQVTMNGAGASTVRLTAPAGRYILIGNPSGTQAATVSGADQVLSYDAAVGQYVETTTLAVGQGALAFSNQGGTITIMATGAPQAIPVATPSATAVSTSTASPTSQPASTAVAGPGSTALTVSIFVDVNRSATSPVDPGVLYVAVYVYQGDRPVTGAVVSGGVSFFGGSPSQDPDITFGPESLGDYAAGEVTLRTPPIARGVLVLLHVDAMLNGAKASADSSYTTK